MDKETLQKAKSIESAIGSLKRVLERINNGEYCLGLIDEKYNKTIRTGKYIDNLLEEYKLTFRDEIKNKIKSLEEELKDL